ncbi:hypothetical protein QR685DRAFT_574215 [Neurospora intermedia]|uniref:Ecp2 effector protein-like domain-containing protein n=1 Tax=Neurospora intermedia TaxID=5142 RepID=A0ABR3D5W6_NEUIN
MQLISVLTALATFKVTAALPSAVKGANDLVTRDGLLGSKLCTDVNFTGNCETITNVAGGLKPNQCIVVDSYLARKGISSIQPLERSWCTYYMTANCQDLSLDNCGHYDATSPIDDLTKLIMHSISQALQLVYLIALTSSISAAIISPVSIHVSRDNTSSSTSIDDSTNSSGPTNSSDSSNSSNSSKSSNSSDLVLNHSLTSTSTSFTSLDIAQAQPSFCPYDSLTQPQPLLLYDLSTTPLVSDCAHILDIINDTQPRGYWTFDTSDLEKGITLIGYGSCAFMIKDGEISEGGDGKNDNNDNNKDKNKKAEQVKWGVEELKFYLGTWLQNQRHGRLGAVGEVDCWVEGEQKKEEGGGEG